MNTTKYKVEYSKNKRRKLFKLLVYITLISVIIGIFYVAVISKNERDLIKISFDNFFKNINNNKIDSLNMLINNILSNIVVTVLVWILGISIIGIPISIIYLIIKSFVLGFTISSLLYTYSIKGIIIMLIYSIPFLINLFIIFILTFYAINFSKMLYLNLFKKEEFNLRKMAITYSKLLCIMIVILLISSIFSSYLMPILLKSFTNLVI